MYKHIYFGCAILFMAVSITKIGTGTPFDLAIIKFFLCLILAQLNYSQEIAEKKQKG